MRLSEFWHQALAELRSGKPVYACWVVDHRKGSPGTKSARMLLTLAGRQYGTIGGGIMEQNELEMAAACLAADSLPSPELQTIEHREAAGESASGLICGGAQTNLRFILSPQRHLEAVEAIAKAAKEEAHCVVCIDSRGIHLCGVAGPWVGDAVSLLGGDTEQWEAQAYLRNLRRIAIFGGGHCGAALARLMLGLGYAVSVIEPRREVLKAAGLPRCVTRIIQPFETGASSVAYPEDTLAVVMTYSMLSDVEALAAAIPCGFQSIGVMGSRPKIAQIRSRMLKKGIARLQVDAIRAPIGLAFNSDTPEEIALSVAAQVLLDREGKNYG
ncbi:MAG: hypothetical protein EA353_04805 [Puniceicoccaceae bacterium]|nr:MAG: hypothetical protein EA353_04805 [Puniceicoccaceae bacterium]